MSEKNEIRDWRGHPETLFNCKPGELGQVFGDAGPLWFEPDVRHAAAAAEFVSDAHRLREFSHCLGQAADCASGVCRWANVLQGPQFRGAHRKLVFGEDFRIPQRISIAEALGVNGGGVDFKCDWLISPDAWALEEKYDVDDRVDLLTCVEACYEAEEKLHQLFSRFGDNAHFVLVHVLRQFDRCAGSQILFGCGSHHEAACALLSSILSRLRFCRGDHSFRDLAELWSGGSLQTCNWDQKLRAEVARMPSPVGASTIAAQPEAAINKNTSGSRTAKCSEPARRIVDALGEMAEHYRTAAWFEEHVGISAALIYRRQSDRRKGGIHLIDERPAMGSGGPNQYHVGQVLLACPRQTVNAGSEKIRAAMTSKPRLTAIAG